MDQDIVRNHVAVSGTAQAFLEYAVTQGHCLNRAALLDGGLPPLFREYPYPLHSWPWFLSGPMRETLEQCVCRIPSLLQRAIEVEFGRDHQRFGEYFNMPEVLAHLYMETKLDLSQLLQRTDAVLTENGLKIMEINAGSNIGGWQIQWMDAQYRKHPSLQPFFSQVACESKNIPLGYMNHVIGNAETVCDSREEEIHVFMVVSVDFFDVEGSANTIGGVFQTALGDRGRTGALHFGSNYDDLRFESSGVYLGDTRITAVVSANQGNGAPTPPQTLYRAYLGQRVVWPDNPFVVTMGDKRSLALLYKHKDHAEFSAEERRMIETFIPWSTEAVAKTVSFRGQSADLQTLLLGQKDCFVVKIANGAKGDDVYVGKYKSEDDWTRIVNRAMSEAGWLVQEFCASLPFYGQIGESGYGVHDVIWGVFGFGRSYGGCWLRLMSRGTGDGIINSAKGAHETIVYEVVT